MRARLRSQEGVALTVAIFTMAVIALFSALVASTAVNVGDTSNRDRDSKRALGAAEAGINTALHRLNSQTSAIDNLGCLTDVQLGVLAQATDYVVAGSTVTVHAGQCPGAQGRAGNGGEWIYWITLLNNDQNCDEQYTTQTQVNNLLSVSIGGISVLRRCVTSIGVVNGVSRRLQREIYSEFRLFHGLIGTEAVTVRNGGNASASHVGSNEAVTMETGSIYSGQVEAQEGADVSITATGQWGVTYRPEPWLLDPIEIAGLQPHTGTISCVLPLLFCPGAMWDGSSANRNLKVDLGETVTLTGGDYWLCGLRMNGGTLEVLGPARVFIDSCGNGFSFTGGLLNVTGLAVPQNLQIFAEPTSDITINGGTVAQANLALYAPESSVTIQKGTGLLAPIVKGSISAETIEMKTGTTFIGDPLLDVLAPFEQIAGKWHPGNWSECPAKPAVEGDPHSGCNG